MTDKSPKVYRMLRDHIDADLTDLTETTDQTDQTDQTETTDRIKASGKLVLYYQGTTTVLETLDHLDTRVVTIKTSRAGDGYRVDTFLDGYQYSRGDDYSQHMNLTDTHDEALHLAIDTLTS